MTGQGDDAGQVVTREELYQMLWTEPATKVAKRLGVSDRYIAQKICPKLDIPFPGSGYWRKRELGRAPPTPPLPERRPGTDQIWQRGKRVRQPPLARSAPMVKTRKRKISGVHALVRELCVRSVMIGARIDQAYYSPSGTRRLADILVTDNTLAKALRFADKLFGSLDAEDHRVMIAPVSEALARAAISSCADGSPGTSLFRWAPERPTVSYVNGVPIGIALVEESEAVNMRYVGRGHYIHERDYQPDKHVGPTWTTKRELPSGRLRLVAYSPFNQFPWSYAWRDTPKASLEDQLHTIVKSLECHAVTLDNDLAQAGWYFDLDT